MDQAKHNPMLREIELYFCKYRIEHYANTEGGEIMAMILAIKHAAKNHQERVRSTDSLGKGHWAIFMMGMVNDHMQEFINLRQCR